MIQLPIVEKDIFILSIIKLTKLFYFIIKLYKLIQNLHLLIITEDGFIKIRKTIFNRRYLIIIKLYNIMLRIH
jgi:hypothetical protein